MSNGWKPGDIALCVRGGRFDNSVLYLSIEHPKTGAKYSVTKVGNFKFAQGNALGLWFSDAPKNTNEERLWVAHRFVKITPEEADEFDKETIALYNNPPKVKEKA